MECTKYHHEIKPTGLLQKYVKPSLQRNLFRNLSRLRSSIYYTGFSKATKHKDPSQKPHNASDKYPTVRHFETEMCTHVHISVTKWCIVGFVRWIYCGLVMSTDNIGSGNDTFSARHKVIA